ncbi:MAG: hypothetical protein J6Y57_07290 [Lachnospiraceae bacterium]|nr:hypothetical protein [Lachnospiraceae bacterium]
MQKRLLALFLVLSLTVGTTCTVYAAEDTEESSGEEHHDSGSDSGSHESHAEAPSDSGSHSDTPSTAPSVSEAAEAAQAASEGIAQTQHDVIVTELDISNSLLPYLDEAAVYIDGGVITGEGNTQTEVTGVTGNLTEAAQALENTDVDTTALEESITQTEENTGKFKDKEKETKDAAEEASSHAENANTAGSKTEALEEKEKAENALAIAETHLYEATDAYDEARKNVNEAEEAYEKALEEQRRAEEQIEAAKKALEEAKNNSAAAKDALKKAQEKAEKAAEKVRELKENKEDLENIKDQYYASMVYYYRRLLGKDAVYEEDGTLDIEENAKKAEETGKAEKEALSPDASGMQLNRYLAKLLIDYMISNNENVDPETANLQIGVKEKGTSSQKLSEGTVFTNAQGEDQTVVTGTKKDIDGNTVSAGEQTEWYTQRSNQDDNGRTNRVKVTYTDKDGVEHVEYYNYIYKSKKFGDETDLENGAVYLALIRYNEDEGQWESSAVEDENNFDDYGELTRALEAIEELEQYEQASRSVDEAMEKVAQLEEIIASLSIESPSNLSKLEEALEEAREELDEAYEKKIALEETVEEARKAVAGIDLSRFNVQVVKDADEITYASPASSGTLPALPIAEDEGLPTIPVIFTPLVPVATPDASLLADSPFMDISPIERPETDDHSLLALKYTPLPDAVIPDDVAASSNLDESEIPGAKTAPPEHEHKHWWLWLLMAVSSITGLHLLGKKKDEEEAEKEA